MAVRLVFVRLSDTAVALVLHQGMGAPALTGGPPVLLEPKWILLSRRWPQRQNSKGFPLAIAFVTPRFGDGSVVGLTGLGDDARIRVQF